MISNILHVSIPKKRRSKTTTEEVGQSEGIDHDEVDYEETKKDEEPLVRTRPSGIAIGGEAHRELKEEIVDHSKELNGLETLSKAAQIQLNMRRARKASRHDFFIQQHPRGSGEGSSVTLEVPDELVFKSSNEGAIVTQEVLESQVITLVVQVLIISLEMKSSQVMSAEKQPGNEELGVDQRDNEPVGDAQADFQMTKNQPKKPEATLIISHQTLSSAEFTS
nr:hypothetical protein [Tanacetum cinerariifolium]